MDDPVIERIARSREPQTVESATRRGELTDNEAYFVLRFAGRLGYMRAMDALHDKFSFRHLLGRLRRNVLWIGGWEHPLLGQSDADMPAWEPRRNGKWRDLTPLTIGPFTYYGWGGDLTLPGGDHLVFTFRGHGAPLEVYISPNGTPQHPKTRRLLHFSDYPLCAGPFTLHSSWFDVDLGGTFLVVRPRHGQVFISPDGTTGHAEVVWLVGGPRGRR